MRRFAFARGALSAVIALSACHDKYDELSAEAEKVRELELKEDVPVEVVSQEEYQARYRAALEETTDEELAELTETYGRMGFWSPDTDVRETYVSSTGWVAASYSDTDKKITVVGEPGDSVVVHEFVHALQDQYFGLDAYDDAETTDAFMARRAVVEGDAKLAEDRFIMIQQDQDLDSVAWDAYIARLEEYSASFLAESGLPPFFVAYPSMVYSYGEVYCAHNLLGVSGAHPEPTRSFPYDWGREDELFQTRIPATTLAVLTHDEQVGGESVGLDIVPEALASDYEPYGTDTLGAWYSYLLLFPVKDSITIDPLTLAFAWRGDSVLFATDLQTSHGAVAWTSTWSDEDSAASVADGLRVLHGVMADEAEPRLGTAADGEVVWLEQDGTRVVFVKNFSAEAAPLVASAARGATSPMRHAAARRLHLEILRRRISL